MHLLNNISGFFLLEFLKDFYFCFKNTLFSFNDSEVILKEEFLNLNYEQLLNLISKDHLSVSSEKIIFSAILKWMNHDLIKRKHMFDQLMSHVRFCLMDSKDLVELAQENLVKENHQTQDLVLKSLQYKLCISSNGSDTSNLNLRPRVPLGLPKVNVY